jgi:hypothetical protein
MGQRMWDNVVMFPFHEIYSISFVNKFKFINYINRWKKSTHNTCTRNIQNVDIILDDRIKNACDQQIQ